MCAIETSSAAGFRVGHDTCRRTQENKWVSIDVLEQPHDKYILALLLMGSQ